MKRAIAINVAVLLVLALPFVAGAGRKPGRGNGNADVAATGCWADPGTVGIGGGYTLHAQGLPTDKALNIRISNDAGSLTFPFGMSMTGTEAFSETAGVLGATTYTFMGEMNGNPKVYAACSVQVV